MYLNVPSDASLFMLRPFSKLFATDYFCCSELAGRWLFGNKAYDQGKVYLLNNAIDLSNSKKKSMSYQEVTEYLKSIVNDVMVTTDGSISEISRDSYVVAEEKVVKELKSSNRTNRIQNDGFFLQKKMV